MEGKAEGKGILSPVLSPGGGGHVGAYFKGRVPLSEVATDLSSISTAERSYS